ncbi:ABC transporter permease [Halobacillus mangrovi]|uniref:Transport permease protein n=1 Tax=Halobacillus mangrovi TaxID=402384 RepID=A0A1W5ZSI5_9BACI|nr:ABC transporter permease [Halobacillus mangrovi]ARI76243.1 Teichoic acid translocation permease TagG [Halobacillus mangrovi]
MTSVFKIFKEQFLHLPLILRLAIYDIKGSYQMHYLGILWQFINPLIQVCVYWFVFGVGLRQVGTVGDTPFIVFLLLGLVPWFFIAPTIIQGSNSVYSKVNLVSKMKFPVSVLPSITILGNMFNFFLMLGILGVVLFFYEINPGIYILQLPYYIASLFIFLFAFTLLSSTISAIIRDYQLMLQSVVRMLFFLTPIFWSIKSFPETVQSIIKLNPLAYIVSGFRDTFLAQGWFFEDWQYMLYFWSLTFLVLVIGSMLHENFKDKFVDYL